MRERDANADGQNRKSAEYFDTFHFESPLEEKKCRNRKNVANVADEVNSVFLSFASAGDGGDDHREDRVVFPRLDVGDLPAGALVGFLERDLVRDDEIEHR